MLPDPSVKYRPFPQVDLPDRTWPSRTITRAPRWLSTDLRDGNQALIDPMNAEKKQRFFDLLIAIGLKEIEVGFPSAGSTEFDFIQTLVRSGGVPEDVTVQVLTQARNDLIDRSFESLEGAHRAVVHMYNAVSPAWRRIVFGMDRAEVKDIAVRGMSRMREQAERRPDTDWRYEYSPETFSTAELDFSLEVCEAVIAVIEPSPEKPLIINLPATVEASTPNIFADQVEWFCRNISRRDSVVISVHPHNDRGTGVAAAELAVMAGADRVEGCLFGNGERTGNVDLVTLALNLHTQGVDGGLDFSDMDTVVSTVEHCNALPVHPRHPYAGELVFTAFSGSHQDAIRKGFTAQAARNDQIWDVPYLPIDPADLGRSYEAVIRVNSQSGKGGIAWVLEKDQGLKLPKAMQADFSRHVQIQADALGRELSGEDIWATFRSVYVPTSAAPLVLVDYEGRATPSGERHFSGRIRLHGQERTVAGKGNGLLSSVLNALGDVDDLDLDIVSYEEHAIGVGADARAAAYVECRTPAGRSVFGVGIDTDVGAASVKALLSAANQVIATRIVAA
ncbi:2-isopropylmalate synthase [Brevundimonas staleyi]|uniref:2-isopropylmalate synthase n=1 Tax=Brevundimonas staleyi TaxID=74326 RepID=A0ABW0FSN9_9CAUL